MALGLIKTGQRVVLKFQSKRKGVGVTREITTTTISEMNKIEIQTNLRTQSLDRLVIGYVDE